MRTSKAPRNCNRRGVTDTVVISWSWRHCCSRRLIDDPVQISSDAMTAQLSKRSSVVQVLALLSYVLVLVDVGANWPLRVCRLMHDGTVLAPREWRERSVICVDLRR